MEIWKRYIIQTDIADGMQTEKNKMQKIYTVEWKREYKEDERLKKLLIEKEEYIRNETTW